MHFFDVIEMVHALRDTGRGGQHRDEGDDDVEMWAISRQLGQPNATKVDDSGSSRPTRARRLANRTGPALV